MVEQGSEDVVFYVTKSKIASWFGQLGQGIQYRLSGGVKKSMLHSNWVQLQESGVFQKYGLRVDDFNLDGNNVSYEDILLSHIPEKGINLQISKNHKILFWIKVEDDFSRHFFELFLVLCFKFKFLKHGGKSEFERKFGFVDGTNSNFLAVSLLDSVVNVQGLIENFGRVEDFLNSKFNIDFNPGSKASFDGVETTQKTLDGRLTPFKRPYFTYIQSKEDKYEFYSYSERKYAKQIFLRTSNLECVYLALQIYSFDYFGTRNLIYLS